MSRLAILAVLGGFYLITVSIGILSGVTKYTFDQKQISLINHPLLEKRGLTSSTCQTDKDCGHGSCNKDGQTNNYYCKCDQGYINRKGVCNYQQRSKLVAFLLSLLVGGLGVDWFYLCYDNGLYIFAGIMKLLTCGGCGIWWLVDWIRVLADAFPDGNSVDLMNW